MKQKAIRKGDKGSAVKDWQNFLFGQGYTKVIADGHFEKITDTSTRDFQKKHKLVSDGVVGNQTYLKAMQLRFQLVDDPIDESTSGPNWPPPPNFRSMPYRRVQSTFGPII